MMYDGSILNKVYDNYSASRVSRRSTYDSLTNIGVRALCDVNSQSRTYYPD